MTRLSVLICDDDPMIRDALHLVLTAEPDIDVVGLARDTDEAFAMAEQHVPAVAVVDVRMPGGGGVRAAREIHRLVPGVRILAFSAYGDAAAVADMRRVGVSDYLIKGARNTEIVAAVRRVAAT